MRFGLILCTVDRSEEVALFLESLARQSHRDFELVVVDQNPDDRVQRVVERYRHRIGEVAYRRLGLRGVSRARNAGLDMLSPRVEVVAFPDDDCVYPDRLLERVAHLFCEHDADVITGRSVERESGRTSCARFLGKRARIGFANLFEIGVTYTMFVRRRALDGIRFDERLGVGAPTPFRSAEETDFVAQLVARGARGIYLPDLVVYHPHKGVDFRNERGRARSYGLGFGAFFRKHMVRGRRLELIPPFVRLFAVRPLGGALLGAARADPDQALYYLTTLAARWRGLLEFDPDAPQPQSGDGDTK